MADRFQSRITQSAYLERVELAVGLWSGPNDLTVNFMGDSGGLPGAVLESFHRVDAMGRFGAWNPPIVLDSVLHLLLSPGATYWVSASLPSDSGGAWCENEAQDRDLMAHRGPGYSWELLRSGDPNGALRVSAEEIPEPSTLIGLWSMGIVALGLAWWRQRRAA